jgi:hypothetical protein
MTTVGGEHKTQTRLFIGLHGHVDERPTYYWEVGDIENQGWQMDTGDEEIRVSPATFPR